jgi:hypothetical protein
LAFNGLHSDVSQKTEHFIIKAVRTSNPTALVFFTFAFLVHVLVRHAVAKLVEALCYKPEGRWFRFPMRSLNFSIYLIDPRVCSASNRNEYHESY